MPVDYIAPSQVAPNAGDLVSEIAVAIHAKVGLGDLGRIVHPYPSLAQAIQACGIRYNRTVWDTIETPEVVDCLRVRNNSDADSRAGSLGGADAPSPPPPPPAAAPPRWPLFAALAYAAAATAAAAALAAKRR